MEWKEIFGPIVVYLGTDELLRRRDEMDEESKRVSQMRDRLQEGLLQQIEGMVVNGSQTNRLPGTLNVTFKYIEGESILYKFDALGIAVSTGSACSSGSTEPSHVLRALGIPREDAFGSVRFSLGYGNTEEDIDYIIETLPPIISRLREISPYGKQGA